MYILKQYDLDDNFISSYSYKEFPTLEVLRRGKDIAYLDRGDYKKLARQLLEEGEASVVTEDQYDEDGYSIETLFFTLEKK